jgi:thiol-disulfide isomerase/thioredoxin
VEAAFSDLVAAYEIIGNAEKRAEFDTTGGGRGEGFFTQEEWMQSGQKDMRGFYAGNPYITQLTEKLWDRRIVGDQVWLVEFYAPWCSACMQFAPTFKALAERLRDEETVAVGAVNCAVEQHLCGSVFNIRAYPTIRLISKRHGTQQEFGDAHARGVESIATWAKEIADEWKWLFSRANLTEFETEEAFQQQVIASSDFWIVLFSDGAECSSCKTAKTNMMRLSAGLLSMARVGFFNCLASHEARAFCSQRDLPASPFAPQVRAFQSGAKQADDKGEMLYSPSEIEPHYALQLYD